MRCCEVGLDSLLRRPSGLASLALRTSQAQQKLRDAEEMALKMARTSSITAALK
jgi:hypothetical protein